MVKSYQRGKDTMGVDPIQHYCSQILELHEGGSKISDYRAGLTTDMKGRWTIGAFDTTKSNKKETPKMKEERVKKNFEGTPFCPHCGEGLDFVSSGDRDIETMGGESIEYVKCERCNQDYEIIGNEIYPTEPPSYY